jgi:hypothetical protein
MFVKEHTIEWKVLLRTGFPPAELQIIIRKLPVSLNTNFY